MDKYDHRKFHAKKLAKERYSSLFFSLLLFLLNWLFLFGLYLATLIMLLSYFLSLDFFFLLEKYSKSLF